MDLARQEYPELLSSLEPDQAINVLNDRITLINKVNGDIADWLLERRKIEETYAAALRKLARRPQQDGANSLGIFQMPWQRIVSGAENMAQSHEDLASKIEMDIENPLRQYASKSREMQSMGNMQGNLTAIAKELSNAQKKADKLNAKGSSKVGGAQSSVEDATAQWSSQAPFVFEQLQALDEGRIAHLQSTLIQLQTHELDRIDKQKSSAESCLNALLSLQTADEIKTFAVRTKEQRGGIARRRESIADGTTRPASSHAPPAPPPPRSAHPEHRQSSIPQLDKPMPPPEPTPQKSKMSGLKRLGTVMGRRKSAAPPPPPSAAEKEKKKDKSKEKSRGFAPFRRGDSSRSFQDLEATGSDLTPAASRDGQASSRHELDSVSQDDRRAESSGQMPPVNGVPVQSPTAISDRAPQLPDPIQPSTANNNTNTIQSASLLSPDSALRPDARSDLRPDPFAAASETGADDSTRNLTIRDQPIHEDEGEAQLAMSTMANQLRVQAQNSGINRVQGSVRGRRDVRNTMFIPPQTDFLNASHTGETATSNIGSTLSNTNAGSAVGGSASELSTPVRKSTTGTIPEDHGIGSDTQSVHSAHSLAGMAHHPEMHLPGLNASIVETVSTWFSDNNVTRSLVVGEVALAYIPTGQEVQQETIRLQNFQVLEKCAQNPTFVNPTTTSGSAEEQAGTYTVALSSIKRPVPTVAFKYQLHMDEKNLGQYSPILITSAWQIVGGQARVILLYSLNPAFQLKEGSQVVTMRNVTITVNLDVKTEGVGKPVSAMMSPTQGASFKKRSGSVLWKFPELTVKPSQERLLAGFTTEGGLAQKGNVELRFEVPDTSASKLGVERMAVVEVDPFADEGERKSAEQQSRWQDLNSKRTLVSGKYSSM